MKRIYVCCILLILVLGLAAFNGFFTDTGGIEGFSTMIMMTDSGSCERKFINSTNYWFCENKNQSDALLSARASEVAPADIICIRRGKTNGYTCLEKDRSDRRYLLNRQKRDLCELLGKSTKDIDATLRRATEIRDTADRTLKKIVDTEPDITKLKGKYTSLSTFLTERKTNIDTQKGILTGYISDLDVPINTNMTSRDLLKLASERAIC